MEIKECIVKGCTNKSNQGNFNGDICSACYKILITGKVGPTTSFISDLQKDSNRLKDCIDDINIDIW